MVINIEKINEERFSFNKNNIAKEGKCVSCGEELDKKEIRSVIRYFENNRYRIFYYIMCKKCKKMNDVYEIDKKFEDLFKKRGW